MTKPLWVMALLGIVVVCIGGYVYCDAEWERGLLSAKRAQVLMVYFGWTNAGRPTGDALRARFAGGDNAFEPHTNFYVIDSTLYYGDFAWTNLISFDGILVVTTNAETIHVKPNGKARLIK